MNVHVIEKDSRPEWAGVPYETYQRLVAESEMLQDIRAYDEAKKATEEGEESVPSEVTYAILDGATPIRVWREHRSLTQQRLAEAASISVPYLSQIESGKRKGRAAVLAAIAQELGLSLDEVVTPKSAGADR